MSLRIWLPLTKDLRNQGLDDVTVTNNGATFNSAGKLGGCYYFNRSTPNYLKIDNPITTATNGISMAFWVKIPSNASGNNQIVHIGNGSGWSNNRCTCFIYQSSSSLVFSCSDGGGSGSANSTQYGCKSSTLALNEWTHIACTYSTGTMKIYLNGVLDKEYTTSIVPSFTSTSYIGVGAAPNTNEPATIYMNDVRIYDHALSSLEVKHISQGLILHYPLNKGGWGQENLLLHTQILTPNSSTSTKNCSQRGSSTRQLRSDGFYEAKCTAAWQGLSTWANAQNLVVGQKYTYSFYFYTNGSTKSLSFYPMMYNSSGARDTSSTLPISIDGSTYQNGNARAFGAFSNTIPIRHYVTFEWNNTMASIINNGGIIELSIQVHGTFNSGEYGCVYAPKLEIGDKMTPWCPNAADTNNMGLNGTIEYDCSGYCNNGTRIGTFDWTTDTPKYQISTYFADGSTSYITASVFMPTDKITTSVWFKGDGSTSGANSYHIPFCLGSGTAEFSVDNAKLYRQGYYINGTRYCDTISGAIVNDGQWHMMTATYDGTTLCRYLDGQLINSKSISGTLNGGTRTLLIGKYYQGGYNNKKVKQSDVRIYATALSAKDVKSLYNNSAYIDNQGNIYGAVYEEV